MPRELSRRRFLKGLLLAAGGLAGEHCTPASSIPTADGATSTRIGGPPVRLTFLHINDLHYNDGGIRADLDAGPITYAELYSVLPFENSLIGLDLTGDQVVRMLEDGIGEHGSEIQVSGLCFEYDPNRGPGARVIEVLVGNVPLDEQRTYRVVTVDYLYTHP
jgi:2',3'-cyclic-nucleotide 2'-phosphodiesterase (5'-nucleotidase family)